MGDVATVQTSRWLYTMGSGVCIVETNRRHREEVHYMFKGGVEELHYETR